MRSFKESQYKVKLMNKDANNYKLIILVLTLCSLLAEEFLDLIFGRLVPRRLPSKLILISLTIVVSLKMKKSKLKTWPIESLMIASASIKVLWIRLRRSSNMVSAFTREVLYQETLSESLISMVLILKLVVVLTLTILPRLAGSE